MTETLSEAAQANSSGIPSPTPEESIVDSTVDRPRWVRPSVALLLLGTGLLYLWNITASGYGNTFYAAAVKAGTQSWKAWLFGSLDAGNLITVDKPPAAMWVTTAFARIFGFSSWTVLAPQALMGVGAVGVLYLTVRRVSGPGAGLLAGAALALTPVAALMFRFNNPDALLVLLMVVGAYCMVRATEKASPRWLMLAGVAIGFGFLTKMLQVFLVLPAFALVYLIAAPTSLGKRLVHLLAGLASIVVTAGWYLALVELWPADQRPYIGGSTNNSLLQLALGYNGLDRIVGNTGGSPAGGPGGGGPGGGMGGMNTAFGGGSGLGRLFGQSMGGEISWLLPAALIGMVALLWFARRTPRTNPLRASVLLWGGWLVVSGIVFSFMSGIVHPYYTVALAPAIAALVAISGRELWRRRKDFSVRLILAAMIAATGVWGFILLDRTPQWAPILRWIVLALAVIVAAAMLVGVRQTRKPTAVLALGVVISLGLGGAAYAVETASLGHHGSVPTSGPVSSAMGGMGRGGLGRPGDFTRDQTALPDASSVPGSGANPRQGANSEQGGVLGGGPGEEESVNQELSTLLSQTSTRWAAATTGSQSAASLELATGKAVMGIGGWGGSDPAPTLAEFQHYVASGQVHYFIAGSQREGDRPGSRGGVESSSSQISAWVAANYQAKTVGGQTVYDLTQG
jgi:4-amino-4-deoxy-L-arabinose transferase-like glycosyltransferase